VYVEEVTFEAEDLGFIAYCIRRGLKLDNYDCMVVSYSETLYSLLHSQRIETIFQQYVLFRSFYRLYSLLHSQRIETYTESRCDVAMNTRDSL